jgi:hypothetical protein
MLVNATSIGRYPARVTLRVPLGVPQAIEAAATDS